MRLKRARTARSDTDAIALHATKDLISKKSKQNTFMLEIAEKEDSDITSLRGSIIQQEQRQSLSQINKGKNMERSFDISVHTPNECKAPVKLAHYSPHSSFKKSSSNESQGALNGLTQQKNKSDIVSQLSNDLPSLQNQQVACEHESLKHQTITALPTDDVPAVILQAKQSDNISNSGSESLQPEHVSLPQLQPELQPEPYQAAVITKQLVSTTTKAEPVLWYEAPLQPSAEEQQADVDDEAVDKEATDSQPLQRWNTFQKQQDEVTPKSPKQISRLFTFHAQADQLVTNEQIQPYKVVITESIITEAYIESNSPFEKEDTIPNDLFKAPLGQTEDLQSDTPEATLRSCSLSHSDKKDAMNFVQDHQSPSQQQNEQTTARRPRLQRSSQTKEEKLQELQCEAQIFDEAFDILCHEEPSYESKSIEQPQASKALKSDLVKPVHESDDSIDPNETDEHPLPSVTVRTPYFENKHVTTAPTVHTSQVASDKVQKTAEIPQELKQIGTLKTSLNAEPQIAKSKLEPIRQTIQPKVSKTSSKLIPEETSINPNTTRDAQEEAKIGSVQQFVKMMARKPIEQIFTTIQSQDKKKPRAVESVQVTLDAKKKVPQAEKVRPVTPKAVAYKTPSRPVTQLETSKAAPMSKPPAKQVSPPRQTAPQKGKPSSPTFVQKGKTSKPMFTPIAQRHSVQITSEETLSKTLAQVEDGISMHNLFMKILEIKKTANKINHRELYQEHLGRRHSQVDQMKQESMRDDTSDILEAKRQHVLGIKTQREKSKQKREEWLHSYRETAILERRKSVLLHKQLDDYHTNLEVAGQLQKIAKPSKKANVELLSQLDEAEQTLNEKLNETWVKEQHKKKREEMAVIMSRNKQPLTRTLSTFNDSESTLMSQRPNGEPKYNDSRTTTPQHVKQLSRNHQLQGKKSQDLFLKSPMVSMKTVPALATCKRK